MDLVDPSSVAAGLAGPVPLALAIVTTLIHELKLRPGDFIYRQSLDVAFTIRGMTLEELSGALECAQQRGWLVFDPVLRVYTLTEAGFALA